MGPTVYCDDFQKVDGIVLTSSTQVTWIGQLTEDEWAEKYVLHLDGKAKLHVGGWFLVTVGVHYLSWSDKAGKMTHTFVPLVYCRTKQKESANACHMALASMNVISDMYFGGRRLLRPGCGASDHGKGIMSGWVLNFGAELPLTGCWAHIAWGLSHGKLLQKSHPRWDQVGVSIAIATVDADTTRYSRYSTDTVQIQSRYRDGILYMQI